jgi:hypothetical protein
MPTRKQKKPRHDGLRDTRTNGKKPKIRLSPAVIALIGTVLAAIITPVVIDILTREKVAIYLVDDSTRTEIEGSVYINGSDNPEYIIFGTEPYTVIVTKIRKVKIRAESHNYKTAHKEIKYGAGKCSIPMERENGNNEMPPLIPLSLVGWKTWNDKLTISDGSMDNECIVNSNGPINEAGVYNTTLNIGLRGRTLVLFFSNTAESVFSEGRMIKATYNTDDSILLPALASILYGEYLPEGDTPPNKGIEFGIPRNFDGKLNLVFYQAELNNLKITAHYR